MKNAIEIGRILKASSTEFLVGCRVSQFEAPGFGNLVRVPLENKLELYGIIYDVRIEEDGLVRQLVTTDAIEPAVLADNRMNRVLPIEMAVKVVGYQLEEKIYHLLAPRPALSLDLIYLCTQDELLAFTSAGRFGYLRHILRATDTPVGELLAAHLTQMRQANASDEWLQAATKELITLLRDDYPTLMTTLGALSDALPE